MQRPYRSPPLFQKTEIGLGGTLETERLVDVAVRSNSSVQWAGMPKVYI